MNLNLNSTSQRHNQFRQSLLSSDKMDENVYGQEPPNLMRNRSIADHKPTINASEVREMPVSKQHLKELQIGGGTVE